VIALRASGADDNPAEASQFVGIPQPVGIKDGDLLVVGIAVPLADLTIMAPDGWTKVARTDPSRPMSVAVYWKHAANEPPHWVFELSGSTRAAGAVAAYAGADGFEPVEAFGLANTAAANPKPIGGVSASLDGEELLLFIASGSVGTFAPATGYVKIARKQQDRVTLEAQRRPLQAAGAVPPGSETFTVTSAVSDDAASVVVALAPSYGKLSVDDVRGLVVRGFPRGVERVYDLAFGGDYYKYFQSWALTLKAYAYDLVDLLRLEATPYLSRYKLPDWERVFGITTSRTSQVGTIPQRQQQVLGAWRAAAGRDASFSTVASVVGALLGYSPTTTVQIVETDRADLTTLNTYTNGTAVSIANGGSFAELIDVVVDGGVVSQGGARLIVTADSFPWAGATDPLTFSLESPDGTLRSWSVPIAQFNVTHANKAYLFGIEFANTPIQGSWFLSVTNNSGGTVNFHWSVFVEGIGPNQETGGAIFDWGVYADPAHLGESGVPSDFPAARLAIQKIAHSHTVGNLLQSLDPYPDVDVDVHAAIPDECIPTT
jgi:hypothetical protein